MLHSIIVIVGLEVVVGLIWIAAQARPGHVIRIRNGSTSILNGKTMEFVRKAVADIWQGGDVIDGIATGSLCGRQSRLMCSK